MSVTLGAREAFRYLIDRQLGAGDIPLAGRYEDAIRARRCRNIFFNAMGPVVTSDGGAIPADTVVQAKTQPFAAPIIVTDILNFDEPVRSGFYWGVVWQLVRLFTSGAGLQQDFFGAGNLTDSLMTLGHYQSNRTNNIDAPSVKQHFMPYLLQPNEVIEVIWEFLDVGVARDQVNPEIDIRGIQVLGKEDAYGQLCGKLREQVCNYIKRYDTETFYLIKKLPLTDFPAASAQVTLNTPIQERPLLILGFATNINGAQIQIFDNSVFWRFCVSPTVPQTVVNGGAVVPGNYGNIQGLPINVPSCNGDLTYHEAYNMFPVPHLLAPNTALQVQLTNGLRSDGLTGTFTQTMNTTNNEGRSTGEGYITFLCRSV
jgi:hypothetical protein